MKRIQFLCCLWLVALAPSQARSQVTDLPPGLYGGMFRDESTGKVWLDIDALTGSYLERLALLAETPFRLATTADIQPLMQASLINDPATGSTRTCFLGGPVGPTDCKHAIFDDSATGSFPEFPGLMGSQVSSPTLFFANDRVDDLSSRGFGTWAVQRIPALRPGDPYSLDFDGDGIDEKVVWRRSSGTFFVRFSASNEILSIQWGLAEDTPIVGDYDGDQIPDLAVWRPSNGTWYLLMSKTLFDKAQPVIVQFGLPGDIAIRTDNDGDSRLDLTVWRPSNGTYYYVKSTTAEVVSEQWGLPGDVPINGGR